MQDFRRVVVLIRVVGCSKANLRVDNRPEIKRKSEHGGGFAMS